MAAVRAVIVTALAAIFLMLAGPPMFAHPQTGYTGVHLHRTGAIVQRNIVDVDRDSPAYRAGLRSGDIVSCLSLRDYGLLFAPDVYKEHPGYVPGTPISLCAEHTGVVRHLRFSADVRPPQPPIYLSDGLAALRLLVYAIFLTCGIALVMARPGTMTWIFFAYCLASVPNLALLVNNTVLQPSLFAAEQTIIGLYGILAGGFLLLFALVVPEDRVPSGWRTYAYRIAGGAVLGFGAVNAFRFMQSTWTVMPSFIGKLYESITVATIVVIIARLTSMERYDRARFAWAAFAISWGVITNVLRNSEVIIPGNSGVIFALLTVVMPLTLMYAILRRHVIDVRFVISRTVVYAAITTIVVVLIGVVDWATSAYLHQARVAMALDALVTIGLGLILHRAYRWVEYGVDFVLFRHKHEAEMYLQRLARTLPFAEREEAVDRALVHDPYDKLELTAAALFRSNGSSYVPARCDGWPPHYLPEFERDHDLVRFLLAERGRLLIKDLRHHVAEPFHEYGAAPAVAIPIFQGNRLTAFTIYAIHRSGTKLDPDEIETLEHLCDAAAQAYTGLELAHYERLAQTQIPVEAL